MFFSSSGLCTQYQSVTYRYQKFFILFGGIGTGIGKNCYRKKVSEPVSEKISTGKMSRNRCRKILVPELNFVANILEFLRFIMGTGTV